MYKKVRFTPLYALISFFLLIAVYCLFISIYSLKNNELTLGPLFAIVGFVVAVVLFLIGCLIRFFYKDHRKIVFAETIFLAILFAAILSFFILNQIL